MIYYVNKANPLLATAIITYGADAPYAILIIHFMKCHFMWNCVVLNNYYCLNL